MLVLVIIVVDTRTVGINALFRNKVNFHMRYQGENWMVLLYQIKHI